MSYDDDNNNGKRIGRGTHPASHPGLDPVGGVIDIAFTIWFLFWVRFIEWHMSRCLCQALSTFWKRRKSGITCIGACFFYHCLEYLV
jgi:hypothetical protein